MQLLKITAPDVYRDLFTQSIIIIIEFNSGTIKIELEVVYFISDKTSDKELGL